MFYVPQTGNADCGFACLKMILANALHDRQYLHLPCDENHGNYNYRDLEKIADENGVTLCGFKVQDKRELMKCTHFPVIVRIKLQPAGRHAVVVVKMNKRRAVIYDPHLGKFKLPTDELLDMWDSTGLFVTSVKKKPYVYEKFEPISKGKKFMAFLLQVLSGISIATGIYFVTPDGPYIIPIIALSIGLVFEILLRVYLYKLMREIDEYFERKYDNVPSNQYFDFYIKSQNFKKNYLSNGLNLMYSILVSVFLIFVIIFNNPMNFPLVIVPILVGAVEHLIFRPREEKALRLMNDEEEKLRDRTLKEDMVMKVKILQGHAYEFSRGMLAKKMLKVLVCLAAAILVQIITDSFTLTNIIFALCLELFLFQNVEPIFSFEKHLEESMVDKAKLSNIFYEPVHHYDEKDGNQ